MSTQMVPNGHQSHKWIYKCWQNVQRQSWKGQTSERISRTEIFRMSIRKIKEDPWCNFYLLFGCNSQKWIYVFLSQMQAQVGQTSDWIPWTKNALGGRSFIHTCWRDGQKQGWDSETLGISQAYLSHIWSLYPTYLRQFWFIFFSHLNLGKIFFILIHFGAW